MMDFSTFFSSDFEGIRNILVGMPLQELVFQTELVFDKLSPAERFQYRTGDFSASVMDKAGRIGFLEVLFTAGIIGSHDLQWVHNSRFSADIHLDHFFFVSGEEELFKLEFEDVVQSKESSRCEITHSKTRTVSIRIPIDRSDVDSHDDVFTLFSTDPKETYHERKTVADDCIEGDEWVDIEYSGVSDNLRYSLKIDRGKEGGSYFLFKDCGVDQCGR